MVKGLTEWVTKWKSNGYRTSRGSPVENADLFQALVKMIDEVEQMGITLRLWKVPRRFNEEADELARRAVDYCMEACLL